MKRSGWVTGAVVAHFLCGALILGICIFLLVLMRHPELRYGKDAAAVVQGLKIALGAISPVVVFVFLSATGLAKNKLWGWWFALLTDAGLSGIFLYSLIDDGLDNIDLDMFVLTAAALSLTVWLVIPAVRRFYWNEGEPNASSMPKEIVAGK